MNDTATKGRKKRGADGINAMFGGNSDAGGDSQYMGNTFNNQNDNLPVNYNEKVYGNYIKQL